MYLAGTHDVLWLKTGSRFFLMKDEVTDVLYICSAIWPFELSKNDTVSLRLRKVFKFTFSASAHWGLFRHAT